MVPSPLIEMNAIGRQIGDLRLGPITLNLEPGLVYAIVGKNGSGKSSVFRMLMGLVHPQSGEIRRFGSPLDVDAMDQTRRIAYVPETFRGHDSWSARDVNDLYRRTYPLFDNAIARGLQDGIDTSQRFSTLSKGLQRRVILAAALASQADLLLVDEPTDGIDPFERQHLAAAFAEFMESGDRAVLMATHNLEDLHRSADIVMLLNGGSQVGTWDKDDLADGWWRMWFANDPGEPLVGEVSRLGTGPVQIITSDFPASRNDMEQRGMGMLNVQRLDVTEVLRILIDRYDNMDGDR